MEDTTIAIADQCWCGSVNLFLAPHPSYLVCRDCGTAKLQSGLATGQDVVVDEKFHLYGDHFWHEQMPKYGCSPITVRARTDLVERAQYWLQKVLKYSLPPGRALEIGCAHGGFVKLLSSAGFEAIGMEMSPAIIELARQWFGVKVIQGPIEYTTEPLGTFDLILMIDVLEHLANPVSSLTAILEQLSPTGLLVVQTPCHEGTSDPTWRMFCPPEHTFLFSHSSVARLLKGLGLVHVQFEPPMFPDDMFLFASAAPVAPLPAERVADALLQTPDGRVTLAMQEMYRDLRALERMDPAERYGVRALGKAFARALLRKSGLRQ
jgi:SAM-dependent methyltransferase